MAVFLAIRNQSRTKRLRGNRQDILQKSDFELIYEYRMMRHQYNLRDDLKITLTTPNTFVEQQVLLSLKLLASGSFQSSAKDNAKVARPTSTATEDE
ncbi:unnamed protein product [Clavelina lepadiformis]|uniref:Uncharacterized protein n=1 Tax=Clavelina lepadiformis TaxID=159417 RepID=A0ABP0FBC5_CLALP